MAFSSYLASTSTIFGGQKYDTWSIKIKAYIKVFGLWNVTNACREPQPLRANYTLAQIKLHKEEMAKRFKALIALHSSINDTIFTKIITCETTKISWKKLEEEFQRSTGKDKCKSSI